MSRQTANNTNTVGANEVLEFDHEPAEQNVGPVENTLQAWLNVLGSFLVYFCSFGIINAFGFFQGYYQSNFLTHYEPSEIALIGTMQLGLMYLTGPVVGSLFDAYGIKVCLRRF